MVKQLIAGILDQGIYSFTRHAQEKLQREQMDQADCVAVLRAGQPEPGEYEGGSYTYRVRTQRMAVVVRFRSPTMLVLITAWRIKQ